MALPVFTPPCNPSPGLTDTPEIKIVRADFGDGYTQSTADMNNIRRVVDAEWPILDMAEAAAMVAFFQARRGYQPFTYRFPHDAAAGKWTVEEYTDTIGSGDYHRITATFRQSFTITS